MKPLDFPLLADENIHPDVIAYLRQQECDVRSIAEEALFGSSDRAILHTAYTEGRVVLTHDSDFGRLAVLAGEPVVGIVFLRPGHINPAFTIETLQAIVRQGRELSPPFILIAARSGNRVRIRLRTL